MRTLLLIILLWLQPPPPTTGYASHYAVGVMERVAQVRKMPEVSCMVAGIHHDIGQWLRVTNVLGYSENCRVTDIAHPHDVARFDRRHIIIELGWPAAQRLCGLQNVREQPPSACPVTIELVSATKRSEQEVMK